MQQETRTKTQPSCKVSNCGLRPKSHPQHAVEPIFIQNATRNRSCVLVFSSVYVCNPMGGLFFFIFYYIIYNIYTYIIIYIQYINRIQIQSKKHKPMKVAGCVFWKIPSTAYCRGDFGRNPQPATLHLGCVLSYRRSLANAFTFHSKRLRVFRPTNPPSAASKRGLPLLRI